MRLEETGSDGLRSSKMRILFGLEADSIDTLLITPIGAVFDLLREGRDYEHMAWFKGCFLNPEKNILAVKCGIGTSSRDSVYYAPRARRLLFLGYCGAVGEHIGVGDIICADKAYLGSDCVSVSPVEGFQSSSIYQVESLSEEEPLSFYSSMVQKGIEGVDMESYSTFSCAKERGIEVINGLYVVTDHLLNLPWYRLTKSDIKKAERSAAEMSASALEMARR